MLNKNEQYQEAYNNIKALCTGENDAIAKMATIVAELYQLDNMDWVGFYRVVGEYTMKIGPYQGRHGCLTIHYPPTRTNAGVCAASARLQKTIIVPNVHEFPGHIACSALTNSEIVVPVFNKNQHITAIFDGDCNQLNGYDQTDQQWLEKIMVEFL